MKHANAPEVIVVGGGPAGSTAATILAQHGHQVLLLEKAKFPRYHIGESLIPYTYFTLNRLGMIPKLKNSHFVNKYSVQFVNTRGKVSQPFYFTKHLPHEAAKTWQVVRSEFDQMLLDNAREHGVEVMEETCVRDFLTNDAGQVTGVRAVLKDGSLREFKAPMTVDASGRDALAISRYHWREPDAKLKKVALWTYYRGATRDPGMDEGATTVAYVPEKGWFWYIPQHNDIISVGIVAEKDYLFSDSRDHAAIFARELDKNPWVKAHCAAGVNLGEYHVTGDFSYRARHCAIDGLVLIGDAFAFLDPVFSSGVMLALTSGESAADAVHAALLADDFSAGRFTEYSRAHCQGIESMRRLVYTFYDHNFSWRKLFEKDASLVADATDCLIGRGQRDYSRLFNAIAEFAELPEPTPHGAPLSPPPKL